MVKSRIKLNKVILLSPNWTILTNTDVVSWISKCSAWWRHTVTRTQQASGQSSDAAACSIDGGRTSWPPTWKYDVIRLPQSMRLYSRYNLTKLFRIWIWNEAALRSLTLGAPLPDLRYIRKLLVAAKELLKMYFIRWVFAISKISTIHVLVVMTQKTKRWSTSKLITTMHYNYNYWRSTTATKSRVRTYNLYAGKP